MSKSTSQAIEDIAKRREEKNRDESVTTRAVDDIVRNREEKKREETVASTVIKAAAPGGLLAAVPTLTAMDVKPKVGENMATRGLGTAPTLGGPAGLTVGTEMQVLDRKIAGKEAERKALLDAPLYSSDEANLNTANRISAIDAEIEELKGQKAGMQSKEDMDEISQMPKEDYDTLLRYMTARNQTIKFNPAGSVYGPVSIPRVEIMHDPAVKALIEKYGKDRVDELAETLSRGFTADAASAYAQAGQAVGEELGFGAIPITVATGILSAPGNLLGMANERMNSTGRYPNADPNHPGSFLGTFTKSANQAGMQKAPEQLVNLGQGFMQMQSKGATNFNPTLYEDVKESPMGKVVDVVGSGAYQVVSTAADSVARAYLGAGLFGGGTTAAKVTSLGLAGVRSFGDTYNDVSAKGGTPGQALVLGILNGGTEVATEYIPLDEWWKIAEGGAKPVAEMLKQAALQGAIEMTQEEIGFLATTMAEYAVLREERISGAEEGPDRRGLLP